MQVINVGICTHLLPHDLEEVKYFTCDEETKPHLRLDALSIQTYDIVSMFPDE